VKDILVLLNSDMRCFVVTAWTWKCMCSVLYTASHGLYRRTQLFKAETDKILLAFIDCARSSEQFGAYQHWKQSSQI